MRQTTEPIGRTLPRVVGARRMLASGRLGAELVRLAEAAATMDRQAAPIPNAPEGAPRPVPSRHHPYQSAAR